MRESICSWQGLIYPFGVNTSRGRPRKNEKRVIPPKERRLKYPHFPEKLEELMSGYRLTQQEVALKAEVRQTAVSKWLTGVTNPSKSAMNLLSMRFNPPVPLWWLTGGPETGPLADAIKKAEEPAEPMPIGRGHTFLSPQPPTARKAWEAQQFATMRQLLLRQDPEIDFHIERQLRLLLRIPQEAPLPHEPTLEDAQRIVSEAIGKNPTVAQEPNSPTQPDAEE